MTFKVFLKELATWAILLGLGWGGCMLTHPKNVKLPFQSTDTGKSSSRYAALEAERLKKAEAALGTCRGYRSRPARLNSE